MCGIGGIYTVKKVATPTSALKRLWKALEDRGAHAAGMAVSWRGADRTVVVKAPKRATVLLKNVDKYAKGKNTRAVMLHTRFATKGSIKDNGNNHPVVRDGITLTHNGVLYTDDNVFNSLGVERDFEVDSEAINVALRHGGPEYMAEECQGSMSIAWIDDKDSTEKVHLFTNGGNPLIIARTKGGNIVWASQRHHLTKAGFKLAESFHAIPYKVYTLSPDGVIRSRFVSEERAEPDVGWKPFTRASVESKGAIKRKGKKAKKTKTVYIDGLSDVDDGLDDWDYDWSDFNWRRFR